jgi:hypothetical protein
MTIAELMSSTPQIKPPSRIARPADRGGAGALVAVLTAAVWWRIGSDAMPLFGGTECGGADGSVTP